MSTFIRDRGMNLGEGRRLISRLDEGIWNRVWAFTDDGRPLELAKLDVALVPRVLLSPPRPSKVF